MTALGLDDIEAFPFVDAPDKRHIQDGIKLLKNWARLKWFAPKWVKNAY